MLVFGQAVTLTVGAVLLVLALRRVLRRVLRDDSPSVVDTVMEPMAGIYGLLLGFLVGGAADRSSELRGAFEQETQSYERVVEIAKRLPAPLSTALQQSLARYAHAEGEARANRKETLGGRRQLDSIWLALATYRPAHPSEETLQAEALTELRVLSDQRRTIGNAVRFAHNGLIWLILLVGAICIIGACVMASENDPRGAYYVGALTAVIITTLYVLYALSRPLKTLPFETPFH